MQIYIPLKYLYFVFGIRDSVDVHLSHFEPRIAATNHSGNTENVLSDIFVDTSNETVTFSFFVFVEPVIISNYILQNDHHDHNNINAS